jgi:hypothetical protein
MVKVNGRDYACTAHKDRGPAVCAGLRAKHADVDRVVVGHVRDVLNAPDVIAWIEQEALQRASELARTSVVPPDRASEERLDREIERLTDAVAEMGLSAALAEKLRKAEAERDALKRARTRVSVAPQPSAIRAHVRTLVTGLDLALRADVARARDALRALLGDIQLIEENGEVYAECDNAAERLLLAVGGVSMGGVAGVRNGIGDALGSGNA